MNDIEKAIEHLKERVIFMENFLKEKESMGTIVLDKEKILNSMALNKLSIIALEKQLNGGWIPVSERLPKEDEEVLITLAHGKATWAYLYQGEWNTMFSTYPIERVIAWQPLPPAYTEVKNDN